MTPYSQAERETRPRSFPFLNHFERDDAMNQANMTQAEILDNMRDLRLRELLDGPTAIGKMHGANPNAADIPPRMMQEWNKYWDRPFDPAATPVPERQGNGGYMFRVSQNQATYSEAGLKSFDLCRETPLNVYANLAPSVGTFWESVFKDYKVTRLD